MEPSRKSAVAALVFALVAVPGIAVAAVAARGDSGDSAGPGSSRHAEGDGHGKGRDRTEEASAPGRAHAEAMKKWARCVAEAVSGSKSGERTGPLEEACDDKPVGPGRVRHQSGDSAPGRSGEHADPHGEMKQKRQ